MSKKENNETKEFMDTLQEMKKENGKMDIELIFKDFIRILTLAIKNTYHPTKTDTKLFLRLTKRHSKEELKLMDKLHQILRKRYMEQREACDILGKIYQEELGLTRKVEVQYFMPNELSNVCGRILLSSRIGGIKEKLKHQSNMIIYNDYCQSGSNILHLAEECKKQIDNYSEKIVFIAEDTDLNCVCMTFIQLAMNKIPAKVIWRNSKTEKEEKVLYTPEFVNKNWFEKIKNRREKEC